MPPVLAFLGTAAGATLASGAVAAGTALYAGSQQKKAAEQAQQASQQAAQQQMAAQQAALDRQTQLNEPFRAGGLMGFDQLLAELIPGYKAAPVGQAPVTSTPAPTPTQGGPPVGSTDYQKLFQEQPGVLQEFNRLNAIADRNSPWYSQHGLDRGAEGFADWWLQNAANGYTAPTVQAQAPQQPQPTTSPLESAAGGQPAPAAPQAGAELLTAQRPDPLPVPTFQRPTDIAAPTFTRPDQGAFNDPGAYGEFKFDPSQLGQDEGYKFNVAEQMKAGNQSFAGRGMLRSGAAVKALQDRAAGLAAQDAQNVFNRQLSGWQANAGNANANRNFLYNAFADGRDNANRNFESDRSSALNLWDAQQQRQDRNFTDDRSTALNLWQTLQNRQDSNFTTDRNFQRQERDTRTGNLFDLSKLGLAAAGNVGGASNAFANAASSIYGSQANAASDAAYARGQANAGMAGSIGGAIGNIFSNWPGSTTPAPAPITNTPIEFVKPWTMPAGTITPNFPRF